MRHLMTIAAILAVAGCSSIQVAVADELAATASSEPASLAESIQAIQAAKDVDEALVAYNAGAAIDRNDLDLNRVYLVRMLELGTPEKAVDQARIIEEAEPTDGLALGVIAFVEARDGNMAEAIAGIILALQDMPDDQFLLSTAGQLAAWFDQAQQTELAEIPDFVQESLKELREKIAQEKDFVAAYDEAADAYRELAAAQEAPDEAASDQDAVNQPAPADDEVAAAEEAPAEFQAAQAPGGVTYTTYVNNSVYATPYWPSYGLIWASYPTPYPWWHHRSHHRSYWHGGHVVFVGRIRDCGLTIGRHRDGDIVIDRARNVYIGHAKTVVVDHARKVVVNDARSVEVNKAGRLTRHSEAATLVADAKGKLVHANNDLSLKDLRTRSSGIRPAGKPAAVVPTSRLQALRDKVDDSHRSGNEASKDNARRDRPAYPKQIAQLLPKTGIAPSTTVPPKTAGPARRPDWLIIDGTSDKKRDDQVAAEPTSAAEKLARTRIDHPKATILPAKPLSTARNDDAKALYRKNASIRIAAEVKTGSNDLPASDKTLTAGAKDKVDRLIMPPSISAKAEADQPKTKLPSPPKELGRSIPAAQPAGPAVKGPAPKEEPARIEPRPSAAPAQSAAGADQPVSPRGDSARNEDSRRKNDSDASSRSSSDDDRRSGKRDSADKRDSRRER